MDYLASLGTAIPDVILPTIKTYQSLLSANKDAILSTPRETHSYGSHPRQMLDVYFPISAATEGSPTILLFFYGGGLERGDKVLPQSNDIIYTNLGYFFSQKLNLLTVIVDYRRMSEGARFPSGGEDVAAAVKWVKSKYGVGNGSRDVFLMGNSAGGVHVATFMLEPRFAALRASISPSIVGGVSLRGYILLAVPFDFRNAAADRAATLKAYFWDRVQEDCPLGLLQSSKPQEGLLPKTLVLWGTLDPEDEIVQPALNFIEEWEGRESLGGLDQVVLEGHNHISPPMALGTGFQREEEWGVTVGKWIHDTRRQTGS
jgi:acetyl esterase/lipase